jgi:hypothetical protein
VCTAPAADDEKKHLFLSARGNGLAITAHGAILSKHLHFPQLERLLGDAGRARTFLEGPKFVPPFVACRRKCTILYSLHHLKYNGALRRYPCFRISFNSEPHITA